MDRTYNTCTIAWDSAERKWESVRCKRLCLSNRRSDSAPSLNPGTGNKRNKYNEKRTEQPTTSVTSRTKLMTKVTTNHCDYFVGTRVPACQWCF
mmetsp:Transcript_5733/g.14211  ORF Transcript_5733/g.14211 Transcript_5733/m.14211 type:complete len:94 (-) Transcript_5733:75-356(-)